MALWFLGLAKVPTHLLALLKTRQKYGAVALGRLQASWLMVDLTLSLEDATSVVCSSTVHTPSAWALPESAGRLWLSPTIAVLFSQQSSFILWIIRDRDRGGWLVWPINNLFSITCLMEAFIWPETRGASLAAAGRCPLLGSSRWVFQSLWPCQLLWRCLLHWKVI